MGAFDITPVIPPDELRGGRVGNLAVAQQRNSLTAARVQLDQAKLEQKTGADAQRLSLEQERVLLMKSQQLAALSAARMKIETAQRMALSAASAYQKMTTLNPKSDDYQKQMLTIKSQHPELAGDKLFLETSTKLDAENATHLHLQEALDTAKQLEQVKADARATLESQKQGSPLNAATAAAHYGTAIKNLQTVAKTYQDAGVELPANLRDFANTILDQGNKALAQLGAVPPAPADTVAPNDAPPSDTSPEIAPAAAPVTVAPAPPDPNSIVAQYLSGAKPAPVASGLPDTADASVTPDEENNP